MGTAMDSGKVTLTCCTRESAWAWVNLIAAEALSGDRLSRKLLPRAIRHALVIERQS